MVTFRQYLEEKKKKKKKRKKNLKTWPKSSRYYGWGYIGYPEPGLGISGDVGGGSE